MVQEVRGLQAQGVWDPLATWLYDYGYWLWLVVVDIWPFVTWLMAKGMVISYMVIIYMTIGYGFWLYGHYLVGSWILIIGQQLVAIVLVMGIGNWLWVWIISYWKLAISYGY